VRDDLPIDQPDAAHGAVEARHLQQSFAQTMHHRRVELRRALREHAGNQNTHQKHLARPGVAHDELTRGGHEAIIP
jgi:hypothetical protein